jgi:hypothetical protein
MLSKCGHGREASRKWPSPLTGLADYGRWLMSDQRFLPTDSQPDEPYQAAFDNGTLGLAIGMVCPGVVQHLMGPGE